MKDEKIFCIGLSKTASTSLSEALSILGYSTNEINGISFESSRLIKIILRIINKYSLYRLPLIKLFYIYIYKIGELNYSDLDYSDYDVYFGPHLANNHKDLDRKYPNARFILCYRNLESWLISCRNNIILGKFDDEYNKLHYDLYDDIEFNEKSFSYNHEKYHFDVLRHFKDQPKKLLVMNITNGDGWGKLVKFLNKPIPNIQFPNVNATKKSS